MVTYWCSWCGARTLGETDEEFHACSRCALEFGRLFGFVPRTLMFPLAPGEDPGSPAASRRRFVFRDAATGEVRGRTAIAAGTEREDIASGE
jgi:hypothetical protein